MIPVSFFTSVSLPNYRHRHLGVMARLSYVPLWRGKEEPDDY